MSSLSRELVFLILQFLDEEKFKETVHKCVAFLPPLPLSLVSSFAGWVGPWALFFFSVIRWEVGWAQATLLFLGFVSRVFVRVFFIYDFFLRDASPDFFFSFGL